MKILLLAFFLVVGVVARAEEGMIPILEIQDVLGVDEDPVCRPYYSSCVRDSDCCSNNCTRDTSEPSFGYVCM